MKCLAILVIAFSIVSMCQASISHNNTNKIQPASFPIKIPGYIVTNQTKTSMCIKSLNVSTITTNDHPPVCEFSCGSCMNLCGSHGFSYFCCEEQWCCCYVYSGPCAQPGVNCWENDCPHV
jgi:hypothetical protein